MKIIMTAREAMDKGIWDEICRLKGWSVWCVNEGRMDSSEEFILSNDELVELGIVSKGTSLARAINERYA